MQILYSCQSKPERVDVAGKGIVDYIYDALGNKLQKRVTEPTGTTVTDYAGLFEYKNNQLQFINHEEGRCRPNVNATGVVNYMYDYFVKDHLQNVRSVVTADVSYGLPSSTAVSAGVVEGGTTTGLGNPIDIAEEGMVSVIKYLATNEIAVANAEEALFNGIPLVRTDKQATTSASDLKASTLDGADANKMVGTSLMVRVMPGDKFTVSAQSYYEDGEDSLVGNGHNLLDALMKAMFGGTNYDGVALGDLPSNIKTVRDALNNPGLANVYHDVVQNSYDPSKPAAFITYIVYDDNMKILAEKSGAIQVDGPSAGWNAMSLPSEIQIDQPGYVLSFISSISKIKVSFDNILFTSYRGRELEEDHYYPFGLTIESASAYANERNDIKYNSKQWQRNEFTSATGVKSSLDFYDYGARMQDPQLGRWNGIDQHSSSYYSLSTYCYAGNNPIVNLDKDGKDIVYINMGGTEQYRIPSTTVFSTYIQSRIDAPDPSQNTSGWVQVPMPKIIQSRGTEVTTGPEYQKNDYIIAARTGYFNQGKNSGTLKLYTEGGGEIPTEAVKSIPDLDPTLVKAVAIQESHAGITGIADIMQSNVAGDWQGGAMKSKVGLEKGQSPSVSTSIFAGIRILAAKGFKGGITYDGDNKKTGHKGTGKSTYTFKGWDKAAANYNSVEGTVGYADAINDMVANAKNPTLANYNK